MSVQGRLFARYLNDLPAGKLEWIGLRPARKEPMQVVESAVAIPGFGLQGDRRCQGSEGSARQVTIISVEYIDTITRLLKKDAIDPALLRRNLLVSGINLKRYAINGFRLAAVIQKLQRCVHPA